MQKFPNKMQRPRIFIGRSHRSEPDLPVNPGLIRRDERRPPIWITRLGLELVFLPLRVARDDRIFGTLKNDFVAFSPDGAEGSICIYEVERVIGVIHQLSS